jgi:EF-P beta-lysylation protein EpmB
MEVNTDPEAVKRATPQPAWRASLARAIRDPEELVRALGLPDELLEPARRTAALFPLLVPRELLARMRRGDPADPILRQVLPLGEEEEDPGAGYSTDPVGESRAVQAPGLLRKYAGRALLLAAPACAVHCRYCFRRHHPYEDVPRGLEAWEPALDHLRSDPTLDEVILSGGDPLVLPDELLGRLAERLAGIPHLTRLRVHTRLPVVIPSRVTEALLSWLTGTRLTPVVVVHANHPNELDDVCRAALRRLVDRGITVLNQSVLLRGVNDDLETLLALCRALVETGVLPYYLHALDPVQGAAHFAVPDEQGRALVAGLREHLPGYAVPRFVREIEGAASKVELPPA